VFAATKFFDESDLRSLHFGTCAVDHDRRFGTDVVGRDQRYAADVVVRCYAFDVVVRYSAVDVRDRCCAFDVRDRRCVFDGVGGGRRESLCTSCRRSSSCELASKGKRPERHLIFKLILILYCEFY
jgi:hypothetical protein